MLNFIALTYEFKPKYLFDIRKKSHTKLTFKRA